MEAVERGDRCRPIAGADTEFKFHELRHCSKDRVNMLFEAIEIVFTIAGSAGPVPDPAAVHAQLNLRYRLGGVERGE